MGSLLHVAFLNLLYYNYRSVVLSVLECPTKVLDR